MLYIIWLIITISYKNANIWDTTIITWKYLGYDQNTSGSTQNMITSTAE